MGTTRAARQLTKVDKSVYPTQADGVTLQTAEGDWELGMMTKVVPADTIDRDFSITDIVIEKVNRPNKTHEIVLYAGKHNIEVGRVRFSVDSTAPGVVPVEVGTRFLPADTPISARLAVQGEGAKIAVISLRVEKRD